MSGYSKKYKKDRKNSEDSDCVEDQICVNQNYKEYGVGDGIKFLELLSEKGLKDRLVDYVIYGKQDVLADNAIIRFISPGEKELINLQTNGKSMKKKTRMFNMQVILIW